ncbi:MAG TPA: hypothetical protein VHA70_15375 [Bauldia sp.]|nr:hypothetical protein [Bauldia sp.]
MTRLMLGLLLAALSTAPAFATTDDEFRQAIVGIWGDEETCSQGQLTFTADGKFVSGSFSDPSDKQEGTYTIANGKLNGAAPDHAMPEVTLSLENGALSFISPDGNRERLYPCPMKPAPQ